MALEAAIDGYISDTVQQVLSYFQSERARLVEKAQSCSNYKLKFEKSTKFDELVLRLMVTPFGLVVNKPEGAEIPKKSRKRALPPVISTPKYDDMKLIASIGGNDLFGNRIVGPSPVIALPHKKCFAFLHEERISLLSPMGKIVATFEIVNDEPFVPRTHNSFHLRFVTQNPRKPDQLIFIENAQLKSIDLPDSPSIGETGILKAKLILPTCRGALGLACSAETGQFFTQTSGCIVAYSLADWAFAGSWPISPPFDRYANVLGARDGYLYCTGNGGSFLTRFPISRNGKVETGKIEVISGGFRKLRAATFDESGAILLAHKGQNRVEVWSPTFEECLCQIQPPGKLNYAPTDISLLAGLNGAKFSRILATGDFAANRIFLFGSPLAEN